MAIAEWEGHVSIVRITTKTENSREEQNNDCSHQLITINWKLTVISKGNWKLIDVCNLELKIKIEILLG